MKNQLIKMGCGYGGRYSSNKNRVALNFFLNVFWCLLITSLVSGCISPPSAKVSSSAPGVQGFDRSKLLAPDKTPKPISPIEIRERVVWVGIATTVANAEITNYFPVLSGKSAKTKGVGALVDDLDSKIQAKLESQRKFPGFDYITDDKRPSDIGLAILINNERFRSEKNFDSKYRWEYRLFGQVVFIDQKKQEISASYPINVQLADVSDEPPSQDQIGEIATLALLGNPEVLTNKTSIFDSAIKVFNGSHLSVKPDYCFAVGDIQMKPQCIKPIYSDSTIKSISLEDDALGDWCSEIAPVLVNHLGNGTGMSFNPYIAQLNGNDNILNLNLLNGASRSINTGGRLSLHLRPPVRTFNLTISELSCAVDPEWSGKYVVNLIFGFKGTISEKVPITDSTKVAYLFDVSLPGFKQLPKSLRDTYWHNARRKLLPEQFKSGDYDEVWCWKNSLDYFLDQITTEMFFPKADKASKYNDIRRDLSQIVHSYN